MSRTRERGRRKAASAHRATVPSPGERTSLLRFPSRENCLWGLFLVLATVLAYQQAWHAAFVWDDDVYITQNKLLTAPDGLRRIWFSLDSPSQYFPLVYTAFRLEYSLWGLNPAGYHWVNILLHAANAVLAWQLLRALRVPGAWLAAAIFALHPVHVESVAWITERKNVLMGVFFLLALLFWVEFTEERSKGKWKFYALALIFYALALSSKATACTLPAALLLILWLKGRPINRRRLAETAPFVVLGVGMGLVTLWWERYHQGTKGELFGIGLPERILVASRAFWFYAGKLLWPAHLCFSYPRWTISVSKLFDYVWLVAAAGFGAAIYFARRHVGRSVEVAALFFVTTLSPVLGFIMLYTFRYSFVADHYQYLASIGPLALAAAGFTTFFDPFEKRAPLLRPILCGALLLALGALTWRQCAMYADANTLWRMTISTNPRSWMAHNNLAINLQHSGRLDEAIAHYKAALEIKPDYAEAYNNLGNTLARMGRQSEAMTRYDQALKIDPNYAEALNDLGNVLLELGRPDEAVAHFTRALEIKPKYAAPHYNLGNRLLQIGDIEGAIAHLEKALEIDPNYAAAHTHLGVAFLRLGRVNESFLHLQRALQLDSSSAEAHNNMGNTLLRMGRPEEALAHLLRALKIDPNNVSALNNAAWLLATSPKSAMRDAVEALELAQRADRLTRGENPVISATLAAAHAEGGRFTEAAKVAQHALELAIRSGNTTLAEAVRTQIALYQAGLPSRDNPEAP